MEPGISSEVKKRKSRELGWMAVIKAKEPSSFEISPWFLEGELWYILDHLVSKRDQPNRQLPETKEANKRRT